MGAYLRSELTQFLLAAILLTAGFAATGLQAPISLALFAALAWLLPLVGGMQALVPLLLLGVGNLPLAIPAILLTCAVFALLEFVVERKLYPRQRHDSVLVLLITIIMVEALGIVGLLIAPPIAKAVQIGLLEWLKPTAGEARAEAGLSPLRQVKERVIVLRETLAGSAQLSPRSLNLLTRLDALMERSNRLVD